MTYTGTIQQAAKSNDKDTALIEGHRNVLRKFLNKYEGPVAIRLWNGDLCHGSPDAACTVILRRPGILRDLVVGRDMVRLAEAYLRGDIDIEGDVEQLFDLVEYLGRLEVSGRETWSAVFKVLRLPGQRKANSAKTTVAPQAPQPNSVETIAHHYDLSNDFYQLWLDAEMVYSCAYFRDTEQTLANAQCDKLDYLCRKLHLASGQTLLDIGCGWGALVCWAARHYGVHAHGITLSEQQYEYANEKVRQERLQQQVTIELRNYSDLTGVACYDRVVSVGMFEHIGVANFPGYFETIKRVLKPVGLFLNHGITSETGWQRTPITDFMNRYVFPDGELARLGHVINAMELAGFEIIDVESLRRHYALTLRHWIQALESRSEAAIDSVGEFAYRLWRIYMAGSAYYFGEGSNNVYQVLAGHIRQPLVTPLRREGLYESCKRA